MGGQEERCPTRSSTLHLLVSYGLDTFHTPSYRSGRQEAPRPSPIYTNYGKGIWDGRTGTVSVQEERRMGGKVSIGPHGKVLFPQESSTAGQEDRRKGWWGLGMEGFLLERCRYRIFAFLRVLQFCESPFSIRRTAILICQIRENISEKSVITNEKTLATH